MTIRPGDEWGSPTTATPAHRITGDDHALAAAIADLDPGTLVSYQPDATTEPTQQGVPR